MSEQHQLELTQLSANYEAEIARLRAEVERLKSEEECPACGPAIDRAEKAERERDEALDRLELAERKLEDGQFCKEGLWYCRDAEEMAMQLQRAEASVQKWEKEGDTRINERIVELTGHQDYLKRQLSKAEAVAEGLKKDLQAIAALRMDHPDNMRIAKGWAEAALRGQALAAWDAGKEGP